MTPTNEAGHGLPELPEPLISGGNDNSRPDLGRGCTGYTAAQVQQYAIDYAAALALSRGVPEGWVLVPIEPTPQMLIPLVHRKWDQQWERGKRMQAEQLHRSTREGNYGYQDWMIPPKTEYEQAAGQYIEMLDRAPSPPAPAAAGAQGEVQQMQAKAQQRVEPIGFRSRLKDGGKKWEYVDHRSPDSFELRECVIEPIYTTPQPAAADGGVRERARELLAREVDADAAATPGLSIEAERIRNGKTDSAFVDAALRAVIAALSSHRQAGEPVAFVFHELTGEVRLVWYSQNAMHNPPPSGTKLYAVPPPVSCLVAEWRDRVNVDPEDPYEHGVSDTLMACADELLALVEKGAGNG